MATNADYILNANFLTGGQGNALPTYMNGRTTGLPLYELDYHILAGRMASLRTLLEHAPDNSLSISHPGCSSRLPSNHMDHSGNLPFGIQANHAFCEFAVPTSGAPFPTLIRLVYDTYRRHFWISGSHYNPWSDLGGTARNPFFFIAKAPFHTFGGQP